MIRKLLIVIFLMGAISVFASDVSIEIQPNIGLKISSSSVLRNYYSKDLIIDYGFTGLFMNDKMNLGLFVACSIYHFGVDDKFSSTGAEHIKGSLLSLGIQRSVKLKCFNIWGRFGLTKHFDDLAFANSDDNRIGLYFSLGSDYPFNNRIGIYGEIAYVLERLSVPEYVNLQYSRHQAFLSGKTFNTGGLLIQTGISIILL